MTSVADPKYKYQIKLDIDQDVNNWYITCNNPNISHGVKWDDRVPKYIYEKIHGKSEEESQEFLISFLKQKYIDEKEQIDNFTNLVKAQYEQKFDKACDKVVEIMGKPLYRNDFTTFLTTAPRAPYSYNQGSTWVPIGWFDPIKMFMHELMHFQFIHYWANDDKSAVSKLSKPQFEYMKESLTVILDMDLCPLIRMPDKGYEKHKEFRKELHKDWVRHHDFDKLVDFGLKRLPDFTK